MTLEGHSECSNWSSKCPFTPKDTYRHCQHLTVAQNARPVRPFPATPPHLTRSARASSRPSGRPHARAGVGRTHGPRWAARTGRGGPQRRCLRASRWTTQGPGPSRSAGTPAARGPLAPRQQPSAPLDDVAAPWRPQRAQGHSVLSRAPSETRPEPQGCAARHAIASGAHFVRVKYHDKRLPCPKLRLAKPLTPLLSTRKCKRA